MTLAEQIKMILEIERQQLPISGNTHGTAVGIIRQLTDIVKVQHEALEYYLSCRINISEDGNIWSGWCHSAGKAEGNRNALNNGVERAREALAL